MPMSNQAPDRKGTIPPKPKRPLTAFNIFSILERNYILQQSLESLSEAPRNDIVNDPYVATRPERYRNIVLPSNWYVVGMNKVSKVERNNHGVISFVNLSKAISDRWNSVDAETKLFCKTIASDEFKRYREDLAEYEEMYGTNALKAQKRTHKKLSQNEDTAEEVHHLSDNERDAGVGGDVSFQSKYVRASRPGSGEIASGSNMEMNHSRSKVAAVRRLTNCNPVGAHLKESSVG